MIAYNWKFAIHHSIPFNHTIYLIFLNQNALSPMNMYSTLVSLNSNQGLECLNICFSTPHTKLNSLYAPLSKYTYLFQNSHMNSLTVFMIPISTRLCKSLCCCRKQISCWQQNYHNILCVHSPSDDMAKQEEEEEGGGGEKQFYSANLILKKILSH